MRITAAHARVTNGAGPSERRPTTNLGLYDLYLRANSINHEAIFSNQIGRNLLESIRLLDEAVSRDPQFFEAYCNLAFVNDELYFIGFDHTAQRLAIAEKAVGAVAKLRPDAAETHLALAIHCYWGFLDYEGARNQLALAQKGLPNDAQVVSLQAYIDRRQNHWTK